MVVKIENPSPAANKDRLSAFLYSKEHYISIFRAALWVLRKIKNWECSQKFTKYFSFQNEINFSCISMTWALYTEKTQLCFLWSSTCLAYIFSSHLHQVIKTWDKKHWGQTWGLNRDNSSLQFLFVLLRPFKLTLVLRVILPEVRWYLNNLA